MKKRKICFVVQRYGREVNGGAELYTRQLAEQMCARCDVSVFTTKAIDYMTWQDEYTADSEDINGVHVHRFGVEHPRRKEVFDELNGRFLRGELYGKLAENGWFEAQGPYTPELLAALQRHKEDYDVFLLCTYLYYPTCYGADIVGDKAILIPMAHDEPFLRLRQIQREFSAVRALFFLTEPEKELVRQRFPGTQALPGVVGGAGIDLPTAINAERFAQKYRLRNPYVVYVGRIDEGKNCDVMFSYWQAYKERHPGPLQLVLMGKPVIPVPQRDDIHALGFVSDEDKFDGMAGARLLWLPSRFESLSMVVLESLLLGVPVLVNGECAVLRSHCQKSNAGLYYEDYLQFEAALRTLLERGDLHAAMAANGPRYVDENYRWDAVTARLADLIETVAGEDGR